MKNQNNDKKLKNKKNDKELNNKWLQNSWDTIFWKLIVKTSWKIEQFWTFSHFDCKEQEEEQQQKRQQCKELETLHAQGNN